jgi:hypothetical protein
MRFVLMLYELGAPSRFLGASPNLKSNHCASPRLDEICETSVVAGTLPLEIQVPARTDCTGLLWASTQHLWRVWSNTPLLFFILCVGPGMPALCSQASILVFVQRKAASSFCLRSHD